MLVAGQDKLAEKLPVLYANLNLNSPEAKLQVLNLLDDTTMSFSLVLDSLQKRAIAQGEIAAPETVQAMASLSKEIRSTIQLKFDIAKELASLEMRKIRMAMDIELHQRRLKTGK
jgi:hypothetical protein